MSALPLGLADGLRVNYGGHLSLFVVVAAQEMRREDEGTVLDGQRARSALYAVTVRYYLGLQLHVLTLCFTNIVCITPYIASAYWCL